MNHWLASDACGFDWSFFAIFDCDMVPHATFLQELLPAMLHIDAAPLVAPAPPPHHHAAVAQPAAGAASEGGVLRVSQDYGVAFIACAQVFRNQPALDPLGHGQDVMYTTWEPALDTTDQVPRRARARCLSLCVCVTDCVCLTVSVCD